MSTTKCGCGSYAINKDKQEPTSPLNKCDVCYWKEKSEKAEAEKHKKTSLLFRALNLLSDASFYSVQSNKEYARLLQDSQNWELWGQD